jgi:hypothetical protein
MAVWEDHLLPLMTCKDAARLRCTCKALRGMVRKHYKDVGTVKVKHLRTALTIFRGARSLALDHLEPLCQGKYVETLVQWLRERGRGSGLERVTIAPHYPGFLRKALEANALPSLRSVLLCLKCPIQRALLMEGLVAAMHELRLVIEGSHTIDMDQVAALSLLQQMHALAKLEISLCGWGFGDSVEWPRFIPPSLKALRIELISQVPSENESFLRARALPAMLEASGARLDRLEMFLPGDFEEYNEELVYLAQVLRCCSPSLRGLLLGTCNVDPEYDPSETDLSASDVERLRGQWADVMAGVSACRNLQVLVLPNVFLESLFPPGAALCRLTHLEIVDYVGENPPDVGARGLWALMASGGLPALTKLSVELAGRWGGLEEVRTRVVPAFEAVAGTLTQLHLAKTDSEWPKSGVEVGYELGVAVGKLRRVKDLALELFNDGRAYHAMAQGLAASGGESPLPLLWRLLLPEGVEVNTDQVASLLRPSVRVFGTCNYNRRAALLTACALRRAGYKHMWAIWWQRDDGPSCSARALSSIAMCKTVHVPCQYSEHPWAIYVRGVLPGGDG